MTTLTLQNTPSKSIPGDLAMWFFILAELLVFGVLFICYGITRFADPALFNAGQSHLHAGQAAWNTLFLITGSGTAVLAANAVNQQQYQKSSLFLLATFASGMLFIVNKLIEFSSYLGQGFTLSTDNFWMFYLFLTFFHFLHVVLGMVIVAAVWFKLKQGHYRNGQTAGVETATSYWHMVDLVWIVLFPLVYLVR